jgi:hypothetical protein
VKEVGRGKCTERSKKADWGAVEERRGETRGKISETRLQGPEEDVPSDSNLRDRVTVHEGLVVPVGSRKTGEVELLVLQNWSKRPSSSTGRLEEE